MDLLVDLVHRSVAAAQPDDFWRRAAQLVPVGLIGVLGDDGKVMGSSVVPNSKIVGLGHAEQADVERTGEEILQSDDQSMAQILIEEQRVKRAGTRRQALRSESDYRRRRPNVGFRLTCFRTMIRIESADSR